MAYLFQIISWEVSSIFLLSDYFWLMVVMRNWTAWATGMGFLYP